MDDETHEGKWFHGSHLNGSDPAKTRRVIENASSEALGYRLRTETDADARLT